MTKLTFPLAAIMLLCSNAFAASSDVQIAQADTTTRAEVRQEARDNPPAAGTSSAKPETAPASSNTTRAEVREEARKSRPVSGAQSPMGSSAVKSQGSRAKVRKETKDAAKAGHGPDTNATMSTK